MIVSESIQWLENVSSNELECNSNTLSLKDTIL
jgi:hypothetical protein